MKLSVAMCTYNGASHLPDQLASILRQARLPDEMIVLDDQSTDTTHDIIRSFAEDAPFEVLVEVNDVNLGSTQNFASAIERCTGDMIALADQDDVWLPHKLAALEEELQANPGTGLVFSDARIVDENGQPLGYGLWHSIGFGVREQRRFQSGAAFESLLRRYRVTGATTAFRSTYKDRILPIPESWIHDGWIALVISADASCTPLPEQLIDYRQHSDQQIGAGRRSLRGQLSTAMDMGTEDFERKTTAYRDGLKRIGAIPGIDPVRLDALREKVAHLDARTSMRRSRYRLPHIVAELAKGRYRRYSMGWKAVGQDLLL